MDSIEKQNKILKVLLRAVIEMLPRHTKNCGVHSAHPNYGDQYCDCKMNLLRQKAEQLAKE